MEGGSQLKDKIIHHFIPDFGVGSNVNIWKLLYIDSTTES